MLLCKRPSDGDSTLAPPQDGEENRCGGSQYKHGRCPLLKCGKFQHIPLANLDSITKRFNLNTTVISQSTVSVANWREQLELHSHMHTFNLGSDAGIMVRDFPATSHSNDENEFEHVHAKPRI